MSEKPIGGPEFLVTVAGQQSTQKETSGVLYVSIEDHVELISVAQITYNVEGVDWSKFKVGEQVEVKVGGASRKAFVGFITGVRHAYQKGTQTVTVTAMGPLVKLASSRVTKVYEKQKDSDVASAVISRAGATAGTVDSTSEKHDYILQRNESDLNFLKRLAGRNGYLLLENEGKVDFKKAQFSGSAVEITHEQLMGLDYNINPSAVPPTLTVIGWDYITKQKVVGTASSGDVVAIGGGKNAVSDNGQIWGQTSYVSDVLVASQSGAKEMAVGEINRLARGYLRGRAIVKGRGDLYAGCKVKFKGLPKGYNPEAFVVSTRHLIEPKKGFSTEISICGNTKPQ